MNFLSRHRAVAHVAMLGMLTVLVSCRTSRAPKPTAPPAAGTTTLQTGTSVEPKSMPAPGTYRIDMAGSEIRVLVYRAGKLASLGHNHVMVNRTLSGSVVSTGNADSSFSFSIPVTGFVVDATQPRLEEGPDFSADVSEDAKNGTRRNMLGAAVLDEAHFPAIKVESTGPIMQAESGLMVNLHIEIAGHEATVSAPFVLASDYGRVIASGSLKLKQTELGMTPYSLMLNALSVEDTMLVKFKIIADR